MGRNRVKQVIELARAIPGGLDGTILLAIGSRMSHCQNSISDDGHGRGWLRIVDRYNTAALAKAQGCDEGKWEGRYRECLSPGLVPTLKASIGIAMDILQEGLRQAQYRKLDEAFWVPVAVASYDCGANLAIKGTLENGSPDTYTSDGNFSRDVLLRQRTIETYLGRASKNGAGR